MKLISSKHAIQFPAVPPVFPDNLHTLLVAYIAFFKKAFVAYREWPTTCRKLLFLYVLETRVCLAAAHKHYYNIRGRDICSQGTSRCNNHYIPSIVEDSLGMSCYNGGIDGSENIYAQYFLLNIMLKKHKPKVICLDVMESYYAVDDDPFKTLTFFAPYIGVDPEADNLFKLAGTYNLYQISHIMRYNAKAVSNIIGCVYSPHAASEKGYLPTPNPPKYPEKFQVLGRQKIDPLKMEYMQKFIDKCKEEGIELVLSVSPMYDRVNSDYYEPLYKLAQSNGIKVMDYHTSGLYSDKPEYFKDNRHLWSKGAQEFSKRFAHDLKQHLGTSNQE